MSTTRALAVAATACCAALAVAYLALHALERLIAACPTEEAP